MRAIVQASTWERLARVRRERRFQNMTAFGLVTLGPLLALMTFLVLGPLQEGANSPKLRLVLLLDLVYVLVVAALVLQRVGRMVAARRARSAGSELHLRLTGVFAFVALIPTVLVAVFAALTVNIGLEGWFSERVREVVGNSLAAAEAYEAEHIRDLQEDARALSNFLTASRRNRTFVTDGDLRLFLTDGQSQIQRGLREAYVIDSSGEIQARGDRSYLFDYEQPTAEEINRALEGDVVIIRDWAQNEFRALIVVYGYFDRLVYVTRDVDGEILSLLDDTQETVLLYNQLESERGRVLFEFGLLYLGFAIILILAAVWLGLWFAERLARPVGRLAAAAARVGEGNLDARVPEEKGDDEIAILGRIFNQMTRQLKAQRETLLENNRQIEARRRLFDSVLSSVTAGVIGMDADGQVEFINRSAEKLLDIRPPADPTPLADCVPEFADLFRTVRETGRETAQEELRLFRGGRQESLLVRLATRRSADGRLEGYVVAFDDVTDLVSAQRMAAWGDVARRIAHEIKNPLTPIQLSAERVKRKFGKMLGDQEADLVQLTDVIVRQTNDLRHIVDEFSKFARMPEPKRKSVDLVDMVRGSVVLQEGNQPDTEIRLSVPDTAVTCDLDATMIGQALTNLIKNAGEAIETRREKTGGPEKGVINVDLSADGINATLKISDNGIGLPPERARLFEPYVTTRDKGTGLGLPIVRKIAEEHGGSLVLVDAEPMDDSGHLGACAVMVLPLATEQKQARMPANEFVK